jgi:hypothetical protein
VTGAGVELTQWEREELLRAWPWPREAATTKDGFDVVVDAVNSILALRGSQYPKVQVSEPE